jgi:pimeloyl-ACP methyl ester carboxylesterase
MFLVMKTRTNILGFTVLSFVGLIIILFLTVPPGQSIRLAGEMPNAHLVLIPQSGHFAYEETASEFLQAVQDFYFLLF